MKIDSLSTTKVISYLNSKHCPFEMKLHDWRVFLEWISHSGDYDVSGIQIQHRTGIDRTNISKAFKRLKEYGILEEVGRKYISHGKSVIVYFFTSDFKEKVENHWVFLTGIKKQPEVTDSNKIDYYEDNDGMLDIPIEEFQPLTINEEFDKEIGYVKSEYEK